MCSLLERSVDFYAGCMRYCGCCRWYLYRYAHPSRGLKTTVEVCQVLHRLQDICKPLQKSENLHKGLQAFGDCWRYAPVQKPANFCTCWWKCGQLCQQLYVWKSHEVVIEPTALMAILNISLRTRHEKYMEMMHYTIKVIPNKKGLWKWKLTLKMKILQYTPKWVLTKHEKVKQVILNKSEAKQTSLLWNIKIRHKEPI